VTYAQNQQTGPWQPADPADAAEDDRDTTAAADTESAESASASADTDAEAPGSASGDEVLADDELDDDEEFDDDTVRARDTELAGLADDDVPDDAELADDAEVDVVVAEVIDETPYQQPAAAATSTDAVPASTVPASTVPADTVPANGRQSAAALSEQWHDIQASFVDDPRGAVERAADAADAAVSALSSSLREYQASLAPSDAGAADDPDTEHLRTALRGYRVLCQNIEDMRQQLSGLETASR
jgi:hypothetical protein